MSEEQQAVCAQYRAKFTPPAPGDTVGVAQPLRLGAPLHGQRYPPEGGESGWYLWTGDGLLADGEFRDLPVDEATALDGRIARFLALPPGWRFTLTSDRENAWFDPTLFEVSDNDA